MCDQWLLDSISHLHRKRSQHSAYTVFRYLPTINNDVNNDNDIRPNIIKQQIITTATTSVSLTTTMPTIISRPHLSNGPVIDMAVICRCRP